MNGFIKIHRKIVDWEWYTDANTYRLFTHLIYKANFKINRWMGIDILPGQLVTGRKELAKELRLSEQEIRTSISKLKSTNEITIKSTNKFSIITICKWGDYQMNLNEEQPTKQPIEQLSNNQQSTTLEEGEENKKKDRVKFTPPTLSEIESYFSLKIREKGIQLNPVREAEIFESHYGAKNWMIGKNKMTDWKMAASGWIARNNNVAENPKSPIPNNVVTEAW